MTLYVIRHGRTGNNDAGIFNGRFDEDINETGIAQAEKARETIKNLDIDIIVCSPLLRTRHTAAIVNAKDLPIITDEHFIERDTGELTGKSAASIDREKFWNYYSDYAKQFKNAETVPEITARVKEGLDGIREKYPDKNILIVTHNGVARAIAYYFNGMPKDGSMLHIGELDNCGIRKYEFK